MRGSTTSDRISNGGRPLESLLKQLFSCYRPIRTSRSASTSRCAFLVGDPSDIAAIEAAAARLFDSDRIETIVFSSGYN